MDWEFFIIRTSAAELNRVATKAATTTMETTILTMVEAVVILNILSSFKILAMRLQATW
jgi:hypothetical protein